MKLHEKSVAWLEKFGAEPRTNTPTSEEWRKLYPDLRWFVPKNKPCDGCGKIIEENYLCQPCADKLFASWIRDWESRSQLQSSFPESSVQPIREKAKRDYAARKKALK